jgi:hypothetical protein
MPVMAICPCASRASMVNTTTRLMVMKYLMRKSMF